MLSLSCASVSSRRKKSAATCLARHIGLARHPRHLFRRGTIQSLESTVRLDIGHFFAHLFENLVQHVAMVPRKTFRTDDSVEYFERRFRTLPRQPGVVKAKQIPLDRLQVCKPIMVILLLTAVISLTAYATSTTLTSSAEECHNRDYEMSQTNGVRTGRTSGASDSIGLPLLGRDRAIDELRHAENCQPSARGQTLGLPGEGHQSAGPSSDRRIVA